MTGAPTTCRGSPRAVTGQNFSKFRVTVAVVPNLPNQESARRATSSTNMGILSHRTRFPSIVAQVLSHGA